MSDKDKYQSAMREMYAQRDQKPEPITGAELIARANKEKAKAKK